MNPGQLLAVEFLAYRDGHRMPASATCQLDSLKNYVISGQKNVRKALISEGFKDFNDTVMVGILGRGKNLKEASVDENHS